MFSNHTAPLSLEEGDRRYFVFNSSAQPRLDDYYNTRHTYISSDAGMNAIYSFLMRRDLGHFSPHGRPPMTQAKEEIVEVSGNPLGTVYRRGDGERISLRAIEMEPGIFMGCAQPISAQRWLWSSCKEPEGGGARLESCRCDPDAAHRRRPQAAPLRPAGVGLQERRS